MADLHAGDKGSNADLADSPLGPDVPIFEPSDRLVAQVAGRKLLRADVAGRYTVTATVSSVSAGVSTVSQTFTAGTYMGMKACGTCHGGGPAATKWSMADSWAKTGHSEIFKDGMNGVASDHYGPGCLGCHTVGYDTNPSAVNGGFDDVAAALKWVFPTVLKMGTFDALPEALKNVGNIQCENCHGPGSQHVLSGGDTRMISVSFDSGTCSQCHDAPTHHIKSAEWSNAMHAVTTRDPSGAGREACVGCHTGTGFVDRVNGVKTPTTAYTPSNCQTCHEPHGRTNPATNTHLVRNLQVVTLKDGTAVTNAGAGALCMNCHQSRQNAAVYAATTAGTARFGPHHGPQADMLEGVNGFMYDKVIPTSAHGAVVKDTCVGCHMQTVDATDPALGKVGGHTFKPGWAGDATTPGKDLVAACQGCHGPMITSFNFALMDYDDDGVIEGVQTEVQHLLDKLALMLPPVGQPKTSLSIDSSWTQPQLKAAYNWLFVTEDRSLGVHNTAYTVGLLDASIADLKANSK